MLQLSSVLVTFRIVVFATVVQFLFSSTTFAQTSHLHLAWDHAGGDEINHYVVYVGTAPSANDVGAYGVPAWQPSYRFAAIPGIQYYFAVTAVSTAGVESPRSEEIVGAIPLLSPPENTSTPVSVTSLTSDQWSPGLPGTTINFAATVDGGAAPYQFKWWVQSGGVWYVAQEWSTSATFAWQPTTSGNYMVAVWARNAGVTADTSQAFAQVPYVISSDVSSVSGTPLSITSLASDRSSPTQPWTPVNFGAVAAGGTGSYEFKWWVQSDGVWYVAQEWSTAAWFTWQPTTSGNYMVAVWARSAGVTADAGEALAQVPHVVSSGVSSVSGTSLSITSLASNQSSPSPAWTSINFAATAAGGTGSYEFKWWVQSGGAWHVARDWSTTDWFTWQPTTPGNHMIAVWARNAGETADASQALAQVPHIIAP